jgi:uncharacterized protein (TIGR02246 family)
MMEGTDETKIRALLDKYANGWGKADASLLKSLWDNKYAECTYIAAEKDTILTGLGEINRYYEETLAAFPASSANIDNVRIAPLRDDLAYAFCELHITWEWKGKERTDHPRATFVLQRRDEQWYVIQYHESIQWDFPA